MAEAPLISFIFGYRNRDLGRVERCLRSLQRQRRGSFEIIFVDYGSSPEVAAEVRELVEEKLGIDYLYSDSRGWPWNRARALNTGARVASGKYLATTDIDLIFPEDFVERLSEKVEVGQVLHIFPELLPRGFKNWDKPFEVGPLPSMGERALGAFHLIERQVYEGIGGFDETFEFWGLEDDDLHRRERLIGLKHRTIEDLRLLHQWHPYANYFTPGFLPDGYWLWLENHLYRNRNEAVRNAEGWGICLGAEQRPLLARIGQEAVGWESWKEVRKIKPDPRLVLGLNEMVIEFDRAERGTIVAISGLDYPRVNGWVTRGMNQLNELLLRIGWRTGIGYARSPVRDNLYMFLQQRKDEVRDFYLGFGKRGETALIWKD
ncbi:MAG: glycosyltransferase family 2 protein [Puniceicoccaceae bacterium]